MSTGNGKKEMPDFGSLGSEFEDDGGGTATATIGRPKKARKVIAEESAPASESKPSVEKGRKKVKPSDADDGNGSKVTKKGIKKAKSLVTKKANIPLPPRERLKHWLMKRCGVEALPALGKMFPNTDGMKNMHVKDIAIFVGTTQDEILREVYSECPVKNIINLSAEVSLKQVKNVAVRIWHDGIFFQDIVVSKLSDDGPGKDSYQCESGRHRLAAIALLYGPDAVVPVRFQKRTHKDARQAVVRANETRNTGPLEKAELVVTQSVNGDMSQSRDIQYGHTANTKTHAIDFAFLSVVHSKIRGCKMEFDVSPTASLGDCVATMASLRGYLTLALKWEPGKKRSEFDSDIVQSIQFLNKVWATMNQNPAYDKKQHMSAQAMRAIGDFYQTRLLGAAQSSNKSPLDWADGVANMVVSLGNCGRWKKEQIASELQGLLKAK